MKTSQLFLPAALLLATASAQSDTPDAATASVEPIPEIIVTAEFRPVELQSIPASLTVIPEQVITSQNAQHLEELLNLAPNVNFANGAGRSRFFQIRGIGERSQYAAPINPSVGVVIDGIDFTGIGSAATVFDVAQVEVLRGPQGTRYGANALAGLINIQTNAPSSETEANIEATAAEYDTFGLGAAVGGTLIADKLLGRFAVQQYRSDGFIENDYLHRDDTNNRDEATARAKLRWLASDKMRVDLTLMHIDIDNGYDAFSLDNNRHTLSDQPGRDNQKTDAVAVNTRINESDALIVELMAAYADSDTEYSYDEDWTYVGIAPGWEYSSFDQYLRDHRNYTLEMRLLSDAAGRILDDTTDWVIGIYHNVRDENLSRNYTYNTGVFTSGYNTVTTALYWQTNSIVTDRLNLVFGIRAEQWNAGYSDSEALAIDTNENLFGGKIGIDYQLSSTQMFYTSLSRGYKAGGVNTDGSLAAELRDFDAEFTWNAEVGLKSNWLDNSLLSRMALFYTKRKEMQVKSSYEITRPDNSTEFIDYFDNAAEGRNYGMELELDWQATNALQLFASAGLLRTEIIRYITKDGYEVSERDQAHAPHYQFAIGAQYNLTDQWYLRADAEGRDKFFFSDQHALESEPYQLLNAKLGYRTGQWGIALWIHNITDEEYRTRGFYFPNDPRDGYTTSGYTQLGDPRMAGVTVKWNL